MVELSLPQIRPPSHPRLSSLQPWSCAPFSIPAAPVRVIPQRSTVKSSAPGLQAQPGWMPHKFTTHSLCYALLYPEGGGKVCGISEVSQIPQHISRKTAFFKKKKINKQINIKKYKSFWLCRWMLSRFQCHVESGVGLKSRICCIKLLLLKCWIKYPHMNACERVHSKDDHKRYTPTGNGNNHEK